MLIDITDTLDVVAKRGAVTGIQRVVIEIVRHKPDAQCITWSRAHKGYRRVPNSVREALIEVNVPVLQAFLRCTTWDRACALFTRKLKVASGETLFLPGLSWVRHKLRPTLKEMQEGGAKLVVFMHDMIPFDYPGFVADAAFADGFRTGFHDIMTHVDHVVTNSQETRRRVESHLGRDIPISISPLAHEHIAPEPCPLASNLGRFVLCVGTIEVRKNHLALLNAWQQMNMFHAPKLVFAGDWGWGVEGLRKKFEHNRFLEKVVTIIPNVNDAQLAWLYQNALFNVLPSHYEGWGLPVGESLWHGTPVVCTPNGALPEVHDKGVAYAPIQEFGQTCTDLLGNPDKLKQLRQEIVHADLRTWEYFCNNIEIP